MFEPIDETLRPAHGMYSGSQCGSRIQQSSVFLSEASRGNSDLTATHRDLLVLHSCTL